METINSSKQRSTIDHPSGLSSFITALGPSHEVQFVLTLEQFADELQLELKIAEEDIRRTRDEIADLRECGSTSELADALEWYSIRLAARNRLVKVAVGLPVGSALGTWSFTFPEWLDYVERLIKASTTAHPPPEPHRDYSGWRKWARSKKTLLRHSSSTASTGRSGHGVRRPITTKQRRQNLTFITLKLAIGRLKFASFLKFKR